jgi:5'(3')-deoxyribonucleotidase
MRPRVLVDVDGVLADFITPACKTMNAIMGTNVTPDQMKSWYLFDAFDFPVEERIREACYTQWKMPGWCFDLEPYPGAVEGLKSIMEIADVHIVTSPMDGRTWAWERAQWLKKYFGFTRSDVSHTDGKFTVAGDVLIDDKKEHCVNWKACHPQGTAILWDCVTNRTQSYEGLKTGDWKEVRTVVESHDYEGVRTWKHRNT